MRSSRPAHACCCPGPSASTSALTMPALWHLAQVDLSAQQDVRRCGPRSISESAKQAHREPVCLKSCNVGQVGPAIAALMSVQERTAVALLSSPPRRHGDAAGGRPSERAQAAAEALQTRVLHLDRELLVIDKPAGLAVQGGPGISYPVSSLTRCILTPGATFTVCKWHASTRMHVGRLQEWVPYSLPATQACRCRSTRH